jgi:hypothetical protein
VSNLVSAIQGGTYYILRVFGNRVLGRIFGPNKNRIIGIWGKFFNEELHKLYCSSNIIRTTKSRRMRWTEHVLRMGRGRMHILV